MICTLTKTTRIIPKRPPFAEAIVKSCCNFKHFLHKYNELYAAQASSCAKSWCKLLQRFITYSIFRLKFKQIISKDSVNNNLLANILLGAGKTHLYNSVDILSSVETHKVHGKHLKLIRPVLELVNVFFQIQPENKMPKCSQNFQLEFSPSIN